MKKINEKIISLKEAQRQNNHKFTSNWKPVLNDGLPFSIPDKPTPVVNLAIDSSPYTGLFIRNLISKFLSKPIFVWTLFYNSV